MPNMRALLSINITPGKVTWNDIKELVSKLDPDQLAMQVHFKDKINSLLVDGGANVLTPFIPIIDIGIIDKAGNGYTVKDGEVFLISESVIVNLTPDCNADKDTPESECNCLPATSIGLANPCISCTHHVIKTDPYDLADVDNCNGHPTL